MHRILVADDDQDDLELIEHVLRAPDRTLRQVTSGAEMVQAIADEEPFDVIVSDVMMPWMNGLSVALTAQRSGLPSRFIFVTGHESAALAALVSRLHDVRLLSKPVPVDELRAAVDAALGG